MLTPKWRIVIYICMAAFFAVIDIGWWEFIATISTPPSMLHIGISSLAVWLGIVLIVERYYDRQRRQR